jgi:ferredoxin
VPVTPDAVRHALEHVIEGIRPGRDLLKFILWSVLLLACIGLLVTQKKIARIRLPLLIGVAVVFGLVLGEAPNPMEAVVKVFKSTRRMEARPLDLAVLLTLFSAMAIVGNKLICGWGCQLGALQDAIHALSPFKKVKKRKVPFWLANTVRIVIFAVFLDFLYGFVFGSGNFVLYHQLNFFKLYNWTLAPVALFLLPFLLVVSFFVYRPFCQFVCPFGLYSWLLENVAVYRVRISEPLCIECDVCVQACPTEAMKGRLHYKRDVFLADCWACGACVQHCPTNAIAFDRTVSHLRAKGIQKGQRSARRGDRRVGTSALRQG